MQLWQEYLFLFIGGDQNGSDLTLTQVLARTILVFLIGVIVVRLGKRRFYGKHTPLDLLLAIIVGSVLSRAINGSARFSDTIVATITLVVLHWIFATLAFYSNSFNTLVTGGARVLIEKGVMQWDAMRASKIGKADLMMALRQQGIDDIANVKRAWFERSGDISVIPWHSSAEKAGQSHQPEK